MDEARTHAFDGWPVVLAKVGDHLVIRHEPAKQPDDFEIAPGFALQTPARLHTVQVAIDVELEQNGWVIVGPTGR